MCKTAIVVGCLLIMGILIMVFAIGMVYFIVKPKRWSLEDYRERLGKHDVSFEDYLKSNREVLNVFSDYGYELHGFLMKHRENSDRFVIVSHGYSTNRWEGLPYANIYYELGYNVYLYDLRHHGENTSSYCSMGFFEHMDIITIAEELRRIYGEQITIGLHGVSLGASSSIMALRLWDQFSFCVADCGFADFKVLMEYLARKWFHLPEFMVIPVCWFSMLFLHFNLGQIRPQDALAVNRTTPILLIHGNRDTFIPICHAHALYEAASGYREFYEIEGAGHAESIIKEPEYYRKLVENFLNRSVSSKVL